MWWERTPEEPRWPSRETNSWNVLRYAVSQPFTPPAWMASTPALALCGPPSEFSFRLTTRVREGAGLPRCTQAHKTRRHSGVLCQAGQHTTRFHGHYSPWKQSERHSRTHVMLTLELRGGGGGSKTISYFRAKSLTKIHFSTPLKKIRNEREAGGRRGWWRAKLKSNKQQRASLLSWIYLCILSLFLIYSPPKPASQFQPFHNSHRCCRRRRRCSGKDCVEAADEWAGDGGGGGGLHKVLKLLVDFCRLSVWYRFIFSRTRHSPCKRRAPM